MLAIRFLNPIYAAITCTTWILIFVWVKSTAPEKDWGDISQAILYRAVVGYLKQIVEKKDNAKFWRSSVLLLAQVFSFTIYIAVTPSPPLWPD